MHQAIQLEYQSLSLTPSLSGQNIKKCINKNTWIHLLTRVVDVFGLVNVTDLGLTFTLRVLVAEF